MLKPGETGWKRVRISCPPPNKVAARRNEAASGISRSRLFFLRQDDPTIWRDLGVVALLRPVVRFAFFDGDRHHILVGLAR
jgi:hypothetical protein